MAVHCVDKFAMAEKFDVADRQPGLFLGFAPRLATFRGDRLCRQGCSNTRLPALSCAGIKGGGLHAK